MIEIDTMNHEISVTYSTDSFFTMEPSELSPTTSQQARIMLQKRRIGGGTPPRLMNIHQAYQPTVRRMSRPYHPMTHPRGNDGNAAEIVRNAKRDKVKSLESELAETRRKLNELLTENRTLQSMVRRQEKSLKHYERNENSLPNILQTHEEDVKVLKTNLIQEKRNTRELEQKLKVRDNELLPLRDKYAKLEKLAQDQKLGERAKLSDEVERQKEIIKEQTEKISMLSRRVMLEKKNLTTLLERERRKRADCEMSLASTLATTERLRLQLEEKQKFITSNAFRFAGQRKYLAKQSLSTVSLGSSFPGLEAQLRSDHELIWRSEAIPEGDDQYLDPEVTDVLASNPRKVSTKRPQNHSSMYSSMSNLNTSYPSVANLNKSPPEKPDSFELPDISTKTADGSVRSSATECHTKEEDSSGEDSLADGLDPEILRIEAGSLTNGFSPHSRDMSRASSEKSSGVALKTPESLAAMKTPESLVALEERTQMERERSLKLKEEENVIEIDEAKKEKLLAALNDIDRGEVTQPVNPRAGLIRELFGSPKLKRRTSMFDQLEQLAISDRNNNDMPATSGRL